MPSIQLSRETIEYRIVRRRRRTIGVVVDEEGGVEVRAPRRASLSEIRDVVDGFRDWIEAQRARQARRRAQRPRVRWGDGCRIPYLGTTLTLRVRDERALFPGRVWLGADEDLVLFVAPGLDGEARAAAVRAAVLGWLVERAADVFHESHRSAAERVGVAASRVRIKDMRSRWGSCGPSRRMSLNWRLVLAPRPIIDYVLVHELVHIEVPDHSRRFWRRVEAACPDFRVHRRWLREHGSSLEL